MFDVGGWEFMLVVVVGLLVIGPKELPAAIRTARMYIRRVRELAAEFRSGIDEVVREAELSEIKTGLEQDIQSALDTDSFKEIGRSLKEDITEGLDPTGGEIFNPTGDYYAPTDDEEPPNSRGESPVALPPGDGEERPAPSADQTDQEDDPERAKAGS